MIVVISPEMFQTLSSLETLYSITLDAYQHGVAHSISRLDSNLITAIPARTFDGAYNLVFLYDRRVRMEYLWTHLLNQ